MSTVAVEEDILATAKRHLDYPSTVKVGLSRRLREPDMTTICQDEATLKAYVAELAKHKEQNPQDLHVRFA